MQIKEESGHIYVPCFVMSKTYGERRYVFHWSIRGEMIGGRTGNGITGYVDDTTRV